MASELNDFLDAGEGGADPAPSEPVEGAAAAPTLTAEPGADTPDDTTAETGAAPRTDDPEDIPEDVRGLRAAVQAERAKRNDHKGRADRLEGETATLKAELEALRKAPPPYIPPPEPPPPMLVPNPMEDPAGYHQYNQKMLYNERLNLSEAMLRDKVDDVDEKVAIFKKAAEANPSLREELARQPHPYQWMYSQAQRIAAMDEIGTDPGAYRAKIEAEIRAKVEAEFASVGTPRAAPSINIPRSLGTTPSSAPRMAAIEAAPDFEDIFRRRKRS